MIAYKVVINNYYYDSDYRSSATVNGLNYKYNIKTINKRIKGTGPFAAFKTLQQAQNFIDVLNTNVINGSKYNLEIWQVKGEKSTSKSFWYTKYKDIHKFVNMRSLLNGQNIVIINGTVFLNTVTFIRKFIMS